MPIFKGKPSTGNLPAPLSIFIGREHEIREVRQLLSVYRLVTLTGPGGCGKTRLALELAYQLMGEFEHGIWFVELASLSDPTLIPQAVASTLDIHQQSGRWLTDILADYLSSHETLLILDNCEHLIAACAQFADTFLQRCPDLKILTTSREVLGITGEAAWTVPPLSLPTQHPWKNPTSVTDPLRIYEESESVQLFVTRAQAVSSEFRLTSETGPWVADICRRLDGMPLAIELAAARVRSLSVQQIAQRLDDRFHLLTSGSRTAPLRQQTLVATLEWSYTLLSPGEQKVLQGLSVFAGGATLEAAEWVCKREDLEAAEVLDALSRLVDKSLITVDKTRGGETRYRLLETIRQYALEKLAISGHIEKARDRHFDYFLQWADMAEPHLTGSEQVMWLDRFEVEHDNLRAALEWCNADASRSFPGLRLAAACGRFWRLHGYSKEGRMRLTAALARPEVQARTFVRAHALTMVSNLAYLQSDYPAMRPLAEEALSIWRELGEEGKVGAAYTLDLLGELETEEGNYERAPAFFQEALDIYKELNHTRGIGEIHMQVGWAAMRTGDYLEARSHLEEFLRIAQQLDDKTELAFAFSGLGEVAIRQGEDERAISLLEKGLALSRERGDRWGIGTLLGSLGWVALRHRDFKRMRDMLSESLAVRREINDKGGIAWCLEKLAEAKFVQSQFQDAAKLFGHAESVRAPLRSVIDPADQPEYNRILAGLRSALGDDMFPALWAEGKTMSLDEAIELALSGSNAESAPSEKEKFGGLTAREREVAALIAQGKSNREIAEAMTVGVKTIETYITRILNKLGFNSRVQIATWAIEKGIHKMELQ